MGSQSQALTFYPQNGIGKIVSKMRIRAEGMHSRDAPQACRVLTLSLASADLGTREDGEDTASGLKSS